MSMKPVMNRSVLLVVGLLVVLLVGGTAAAGDLIILHSNDIHGRLESHGSEERGGMVRLATLVENQREHWGAERVMLLDAGDTIHGTNIVNLFDGIPAIEVMNYMGYNAMVLGNHEFNFGQGVLQERIEDADFPILGANVIYDEDGSPFTASAYIEEISGVRVGVIGLATEDTPVTTHPDNVLGLTFAEPAGIASILAQRLKDVHDVDVLIALTHVGLEVDEKLASAVPELDVIVGGHSHSTLTEPAEVNGTLIVQAHEYANFLGSLALTVEDRAVVDYDYHLLPVTQAVPKHPGVQGIIEEWNEVLDERLGEEIGWTGTDWEGEREDVRTRETNLGNLIADIMREAVHADAAVTNGGGIRASIAAGDITVEDIYTVLPFDNTILALELTGQQLLEALEHGVRQYPEASGGFLQVSDIEFTIDADAEPGQRVTNVYVAGAPLDTGKTYTVATNDFLAAGGDGYEMLADAEVAADTGVMMRDIVVDYISRHGVPLEPEMGRISVQ